MEECLAQILALDEDRFIANFLLIPYINSVVPYYVSVAPLIFIFVAL